MKRGRGSETKSECDSGLLEIQKIRGKTRTDYGLHFELSWRTVRGVVIIFNICPISFSNNIRKKMLLFIWTFNKVLLCLADKGEFN